MLKFETKNKELHILLKEDIIHYDNTPDKTQLYALADKSTSVNINAAELKLWDSTLLVILYQIAKITQKNNIPLHFENMPENLQHLIELSIEVDRKPSLQTSRKSPFLEVVGIFALGLYQSLNRAVSFIGQTLQSWGRFFKGKAILRKADFLFSLEDCGYKAIGIMSLVSFMVGLILAFVGAIQLKTFGAQIYVASLVTIGMTRIMGAIMAGIIMSGRTGASYAATIGTMQVNEEIDALKTMGIPVIDFLVLPRMLSLIISMPILTVLADFMGMLGGAFVGVIMLDISPQEYWKFSVDALNLTNFLVGVFHGFVFGIIIALSGCYYGINCGRNADSVGLSTTKAVVSSIVLMIVATGIITMIFEVCGI